MNPPAATAIATRLAIGADLGGTKVAVGVVDSEQRVLGRWQEPSAGLDPTALLARIEAVLARALEAHPEAGAVGLGLPCAIDHERGVARSAVNLPLADVPIRDLVSERLGLPVFLDNDANVAALAEHRFGAARGTENAVMLTIGTGVGGGVVLGGEIFRGRGAAPEIGHIVVDADGPPCQGSCPNRGCIEALASGTALGREGRAAAAAHPDSALGHALAAGERIDGKDVMEAALAGDEVARNVFELVGTRLGAALASLANMFAPDVFVIGGGAAAAGDLLLDPARTELARRALSPHDEIPVVLAELGPEAGMVGAATLALESVRG